jgi:hypothetical protein
MRCKKWSSLRNINIDLDRVCNMNRIGVFKNDKG